MAVNDIYKLSWNWTRGASFRPMSCGIYVKQDSSTGFTIGDVGPGMVNWWNTELNSSGLTTGVKALYSSAVGLTSITMRKVKPLEQVIDTYTTGLPIAGTGAGAAMPAQDAVLVSLRTALIGRANRGRIYLPPVREGALDENFTFAAAEDIAQQFGGLNTALEGTLYDLTWVVFSRSQDIGIPVTTIKVDEFLRTQRRRATRPPTYASASA